MRTLVPVLAALVLLPLTATAARAHVLPAKPADVVAPGVAGVPAGVRLERAPLPAGAVAAAPEEDPWSFGLGLAVSLAQGNAESFDLSADGKVAYEKGPLAWKLKALFAYGEKEGSTSTEAWHATLHVENKLSERVYVFGNLDFDRDVPAELEYRWTPVAGLGFVLAKTRTIELKGEVGGGYTIEKRVGQSSTADPAAYLGFHYEKTWDAGAVLTAEYKFVPNLSDFDLSVMTWEARLAQPVCAEIDLTVSLRVDHVIDPPAPSEATDILLALGLRANF